MQIVLIGAGNTASVLGRKIREEGHEILQVWSRSVNNANSLAAELKARAETSLRKVVGNADIYIIAVPDDVIQETAAQLDLHNHLVVHTAGSVSKNVLEKASRNFGVLYPLQSLRKEMPLVPEIPFLVDGNTSDDLTLIYDFAETISTRVKVASDEERRSLHLSAVIVSNFSNHLYALAEEFCRHSNTDFSLLYPLINEVANRIEFKSPSELQTGPAYREDQETIQKHEDLLKNFPEIKNLYANFTKSIQDFHKKK
jgi:predicted short-subunit dehydrogenase-like oxidoreductase (DUF2520 family)